jgi:ribosomal protein L7/L12
VRGATGLSLAEATELVSRAPIEVLTEVSERDAEAARDAMVAAGADAEVLGPQHLRRVP